MQNSPIETPRGGNFAPPDHVCLDVDKHGNHTTSSNKHVDFDSVDDDSSSSSSLSSDQNDVGEYFSVVCPLMPPPGGGCDSTYPYHYHDPKFSKRFGINYSRMQEKWDFIRKHYYDIIGTTTQKVKNAIVPLLRNRHKASPYVAIFDIDDTVVSTCGMCPKYAETCRSVVNFLSGVSEKRSRGDCFTPIQPVKELYEWIQDRGIDIYFITMRSNKFSGATQKLLKENGFRGYKQLMMRPDSVQPSGQWKSMCRSKIGRPLLLNIGDKKTDLDNYGIDDAAACVSIRIPNIIEYIVG